MTGTPKSVIARWHQWTEPYDDYSPQDAQCYEASDDFHYQHDFANEDSYSLLEPQDVCEIMYQIRDGASLEIIHLLHFTDEDTDCVAEILELNAIEEHRDDMLLVAACHFTQFHNPLIAELLIIHRLGKGDTVDEIVYNSWVGESFYGDSEDLREDFLPFVTKCDKKRLYDKLDLNLKPLGLAKRVVKI